MPISASIHRRAALTLVAALFAIACSLPVIKSSPLPTKAATLVDGSPAEAASFLRQNDFLRNAAGTTYRLEYAAYA